MRMEKVVVAIPAYNEAATIAGVIETLAAEKVEIPGMEIMVSDGGSVDDTAAIVRQMAQRFDCVSLIGSRERHNAATNVNRVALAATADILVRCDAHSVYPSRFVARLLESLERSGATSVVIPMDSIGRTCVQKAVAWVSDTLLGSGGSAHRGGRRSGFIDHGHHAAFRLDAFRAVRGYDQSFPANEDAELDSRLRAAGGTIWLDADIRIGYFPRGSFVRLWSQYDRYGEGRALTVRRHRAIRLRQMAVPGNLLLLLASVAAAATTQSWLWLAWPAFYASLLVSASLALALRHRALCGLLAGVAAFTMHIAYGLGFWRGFLLRRLPVPVSVIPQTGLANPAHLAKA